MTELFVDFLLAGIDGGWLVHYLCWNCLNITSVLLGDLAKQFYLSRFDQHVAVASDAHYRKILTNWLSCKSWLDRKFYKLLLGRITLNNMILNLIMIAYLESELYVKMIWEMAFKYLSLKGLSSWTPKTSQKFNSSFSVVIFEEKWIWKSYKNNQCYLYCKNVLSKVLLVKGISEKIGKSINDRSPYRNRNSEMISFWT